RFGRGAIFIAGTKCRCQVCQHESLAFEIARQQGHLAALIVLELCREIALAHARLGDIDQQEVLFLFYVAFEGKSPGSRQCDLEQIADHTQRWTFGPESGIDAPLAEQVGCHTIKIDTYATIFEPAPGFHGRRIDFLRSYRQQAISMYLAADFLFAEHALYP